MGAFVRSQSGRLGRSGGAHPGRLLRTGVYAVPFFSPHPLAEVTRMRRLRQVQVASYPDSGAESRSMAFYCGTGGLLYATPPFGQWWHGYREAAHVPGGPTVNDVRYFDGEIIAATADGLRRLGAHWYPAQNWWPAELAGKNWISISQGAPAQYVALADDGSIAENRTVGGLQVIHQHTGGTLTAIAQGSAGHILVVGLDGLILYARNGSSPFTVLTPPTAFATTRWRDVAWMEHRGGLVPNTWYDYTSFVLVGDRGKLLRYRPPGLLSIDAPYGEWPALFTPITTSTQQDLRSVSVHYLTPGVHAHAYTTVGGSAYARTWGNDAQFLPFIYELPAGCNPRSVVARGRGAATVLTDAGLFSCQIRPKPPLYLEPEVGPWEAGDVAYEGAGAGPGAYQVTVVGSGIGADGTYRCAYTSPPVAYRGASSDGQTTLELARNWLDDTDTNPFVQSPQMPTWFLTVRRGGERWLAGVFDVLVTPSTLTLTGLGGGTATIVPA